MLYVEQSIARDLPGLRQYRLHRRYLAFARLWKQMPDVQRVGETRSYAGKLEWPERMLLSW